jgi:hypothetical protein
MKTKNLILTIIKNSLLVIFILLICSICLNGFGQDVVKNTGTENAKEWWVPITKQHNIEIKNPKVFNNIFIDGVTFQKFKDSIVFYKAFLIFNDKDNYTIFTAPVLSFNEIDSTIIITRACKREVYEVKRQSLKPVVFGQLSYFKYEIKTFTSNSLCDSIWIDPTYSPKKRYNIGIKK